MIVRFKVKEEEMNRTRKWLVVGEQLIFLDLAGCTTPTLTLTIHENERTFDETP
jgi:hypothetical protein